MNDFIQTATIIALIVNTFALLFVIYQIWLAKQSLNATRKSVDDAKTERQLEILPKFTWVIQVQVNLEGWKGDLHEKQEKLQLSLSKKDENILKELSNTSIKSSKDLKLNRFLYENMPSYLREIWMSGAQYYYNAMASMPYLWREDGGPQYSLAGSLKNRCIESENAIDILLGYIKDMVPPVILETPASLSDEDFLRD